MILRYFFYLLLSSLTALTFGQGVQFQKMSFEKAISEAGAEDKMIFLDLYTTWCGPCRWMDKNVFNRSDIGEQFNSQFVNLKIDAEKGEGIDLSRRYSVTGYPTYLYFDKRGNLIHRTFGVMRPEQVLSIARGVGYREGQFVTLLREFNEGNRSDTLLHLLATISKWSVDADSSRSIGLMYLKRRQSWLDEKSIRLISGLVMGDDDTLFYFMRKHPDEFKDVIGEEKYEDILYWAVYDGIPAKLNFPPGKPAPDELNHRIVKARVYFEEKLPMLCDRLDAGHRLDLYRMTRNWAEYAKAAGLWLKSGGKMPDQLNSIAWNIATNSVERTAYEQGLRLIDKSIERGRTADNMYVKALLCKKLGLDDQARSLANISLEFSRHANSDSSKVKELLKSLGDN